jgi:hypothetical protein
MADLKLLANDTVVLPTVRDHLKLRIKESDKSKLNSIFEQELCIHMYYHVSTNGCYLFMFFIMMFLGSGEDQSYFIFSSVY